MPKDGRHRVREASQPARGAWRAFQPAAWACAFAATAAWLAAGAVPDAHSLILVGALILLGNLADLRAVQLQPGMRVGTAHFAAPFAIVVAGVPAGIMAAAGCLIGRWITRRDDWNAFDVAVNVLAAAVAGTMWLLTTLAAGGTVVIPAIITVVAFALTRVLVNLAWTFEARSRGMDIPTIAVPVGRLMLAAALLFTPAVAMLGTDRSAPWTTLMLLVLPFVATQFLINAFGRERRLNTQLEHANISLTESLVNALDARDPYSAGHSVAVAIYSRDIAREMGLDEASVQRVHLAGLLHDIGKIAVPDAVLRKPSALTDAEFDEIRAHPAIGEQILAPNEHLRDLLPAIRHHHERIDGKGYPDQLRDASIPLHARIIAVADAYDAMTSNRPYRDAMPPALAERVLVQNQGMQHDPFIVAAFRAVIARRGPDYAAGIGPEFEAGTRIRALVQPDRSAISHIDAA